jgi:hypothetical protein
MSVEYMIERCAQEGMDPEALEMLKKQVRAVSFTACQAQRLDLDGASSHGVVHH